MSARTHSAAPVGILILDTAFERIPGDAGHPRTWPFPVRYQTVVGANPARVIDGEAEGLLGPFVDAGRALVMQGVRAITTTCGFLALFQEELAAALPVPVATSSLLQVPTVQRLLGRGQQVGIVTMDPARLTSRHLAAVGIAGKVPMEGLRRDGPFWDMVLHDKPASPGELEEEVLTAADRLLRRDPGVGALVLECANMPTFSAALARRFGRPVYDIVTLVTWMQAGVAPSGYPMREDPHRPALARARG